MITIDQAFSLPAIAMYAAIAGIALHAFARGWLPPVLTRRETVVASKLLFIVTGIMLLIALRNSNALPAGQFIYGRF